MKVIHVKIELFFKIFVLNQIRVKQSSSKNRNEFTICFYGVFFIKDEIDITNIIGDYSFTIVFKYGLIFFYYVIVKFDEFSLCCVLTSNRVSESIAE